MCFHKDEAPLEIPDNNDSDDYDDDHYNDDRYNDADSEDISLSDYDMPLSEYELAAKRRRQENHQLAMSLGIAKVIHSLYIYVTIKMQMYAIKSAIFTACRNQGNQPLPNQRLDHQQLQHHHHFP